MKNTPFDLAGKTALITGSTGGIGLELALALGQAGARILVNGRAAERVDQARDILQRAGIDTGAALFDVSSNSAVDTAFAEVAELAEPIDILINNAGIQQRGELIDFDPIDFETIVSTNLVSAHRVARHVVRGMIGRGQGSIVNVCSVQSKLARPSIAPYAAAKAGLAMLTKAMATEWGQHNIRVNGLAPGYFDTELNKALVTDPAFSHWIAGRTPLGRWGRLDELRGPALFLCSEASSFVTGHILYVDGGITSCL